MTHAPLTAYLAYTGEVHLSRPDGIGSTPIVLDARGPIPSPFAYSAERGILPADAEPGPEESVYTVTTWEDAKAAARRRDPVVLAALRERNIYQ